jgi:hypothetical protein
MLVREFNKIWRPCLTLIFCTGCSRAPSIEFIGTFFPVWMFCILSALALTGLIRAVLVRFGLEQKVGSLVVFYPSLLVGFSCLLWLIWFS